jgi:hypothetical protein
MSYNNRRKILRGKETSQWLLVLPSTVNGTELSAQEFSDALLLQYAHYPPGLPVQCNGCQQKSSVRYVLECKCSGLVISMRNDIRDELSGLTSKASFAESIPVALRSQNQAPESRRAQPSSASFKTMARKTVAISWYKGFGLTELTA